MDTEHGGVGEEVCYRSDLPLWATPLTPWAPVATPNPLGRGAGGRAAGAKHHITCLFRQQPSWEIIRPFFQGNFIRMALLAGLPAGHV